MLRLAKFIPSTSEICRSIILNRYVTKGLILSSVTVLVSCVSMRQSSAHGRRSVTFGPTKTNCDGLLEVTNQPDGEKIGSVHEAEMLLKDLARRKFYWFSKDEQFIADSLDILSTFFKSN